MQLGSPDFLLVLTWISEMNFPAKKIQRICQSCSRNSNFLVRFVFVKTWHFQNAFSTGKIEKIYFWNVNNSTNFKHEYLKNRKCKVISMHVIRKLIEYSFKHLLVKVMFMLTVFEILLFRVQEAKGLNFQSKAKKYSDFD